MSVPKIPSYTQMPNNLKELLSIQRNYFKKFGEGLTNLTKVTKLTDKRVTTATKTINNIKKLAQSSKTVTDNLKKGNFRKVNPNLGMAIGLGLGIANTGLNLLTINQIGKLQSIQLSKEGIIQKDIADTFQQVVTNTIAIRRIKQDYNNLINSYKVDKDSLYAEIGSVQSGITDLRSVTLDAKKLGNDALYEVRTGRQIIEKNVSNLFSTLSKEVGIQNSQLLSKTAEARQLANDALYEVRAGRQNIENKVNDLFTTLSNEVGIQNSQLLSKTAEARQLANDALYEVRAGRQNMELNFGNQLNSLINELNLRTSNSEARIRREVDQLFNNSRKLINNNSTKVKDTQKELGLIRGQLRKVQQDFGLLKQNKNSIDNIDSRIKSLVENSPKINQLLFFIDLIDSKVKDINVSRIPKINGRIDALFQKTSDLDKRTKKLEHTDSSRIIDRIRTVEKGLGTTETDISKIKTDIKENKKLEKKQFDTLLKEIALIPPLIAKVPNNTIQKMPPPLTSKQIETATGDAICKSSGPGGCMNKGLGNTTNNISNNFNQNFNRFEKNILDKINAGANAAELLLLKKIDKKLGPQISGGISNFLNGFKRQFDDYLKIFDSFLSKFGGFIEWAKFDRILNVFTWWQTLHNASMLSSDIVSTLVRGIDNVLAVIGVKDIDGQPINIGEILGKAYKDTLVSVLGKETYQNLNKTWNAANRIYQSASNIVNTVLNIQQSVLTALEAIGAGVGKLANALRAAGQVFDDAYEWMNPNPNYSNRLFTFLNNLGEAASTIESVTQAPLEVKQAIESLKEEQKELSTALKDTEKGLKGLGVIESETVKKEQLKSKEASEGTDLSNSDKLEVE